MIIDVPEKLAFIPLEKFRYKGAYGGRGAGKSWAFADATIKYIMADLGKPLRILCTRELQNSIKDSVHRLLVDRIAYYGLENSFHITDHEIRGKNGSLYIFKGLRSNITEIKSMEGIDICWIEEAEKVSQESLDVLIPTIRNPDSEIWFSWNTGTKQDPVWKMLVENPRHDAMVQLVNYYDNPWFPDVLQKEMEHDKLTNYKKYERVWLGKPSEGGLFFSNFDAELMAEDPFVIEPHLGARRTFGGFDFGWGTDGFASYGQWYLDGKGVPHRQFHWYKQNITAQEQAEDLFQTIQSFYFSGGVFPEKIAYDYEMDTKPGTEQSAWSPIDYFTERWKKGGQNPGAWIPANKKRVPGWQIVTDYLGKDSTTMAPKMRYWPQYNKDWVESMKNVECKESNPLDLHKCEIDHPCDETRYCLVYLRSLGTEKTAQDIKKGVNRGVERDIRAAEKLIEKGIAA